MIISKLFEQTCWKSKPTKNKSIKNKSLKLPKCSSVAAPFSFHLPFWFWSLGWLLENHRRRLLATCPLSWDRYTALAARTLHISARIPLAPEKLEDPWHATLWMMNIKLASKTHKVNYHQLSHRNDCKHLALADKFVDYCRWYFEHLRTAISYRLFMMANRSPRPGLQNSTSAPLRRPLLAVAPAEGCPAAAPARCWAAWFGDPGCRAAPPHLPCGPGCWRDQSPARARERWHPRESENVPRVCDEESILKAARYLGMLGQLHQTRQFPIFRGLTRLTWREEHAWTERNDSVQATLLPIWHWAQACVNCRWDFDRKEPRSHLQWKQKTLRIQWLKLYSLPTYSRVWNGWAWDSCILPAFRCIPNQIQVIHPYFNNL